jgi:phosphate transport system substrate-binding protein
MRVAILKSLTAVSLLLLLAAGQAPAAETLRIAGTGGALGILRQIAAQSVASTGIQLEIIPGLGSTGAIRAVTDGVIDLAVSTQLLGPEQTASGLTAVPLARTASSSSTI